ncbi:MAG: DNA polymerase I [Myxococcales bacterium]|nr:DNA polymerase I [Myxococcales bacterium]
MSKTRAKKPSPSVRIAIVDAANFLYRAFFAIPGLRASDGTPTNAVYGFANMLNKLVREESPDAILIALDPRGKTFRHETYPEYKGTRDAQPEDLSAQMPLFRELLEAWALPTIEVAGFEADDVIATVAARAPKGAEIVIVSTDKDLMQLVEDGRVCLLDTMKDRRYGAAEVEARFGVPPGQVLDLRALVGDSSDNIPGVKGIGEKGAAKLIQEWGDLDNLLAHAADVKAKRAREALQEHADAARLSKELATLRADAPIELDLESLPRVEPDAERLLDLYQRLDFSRLVDALRNEGAGGAERGEPAVATEIVGDEAGLKKLAKRLAEQDAIALHLVGCEQGAMRDEPVGVALSLPDDGSAYLPLAHEGLGESTALELSHAIDALRPLLAGKKARPWAALDAKLVQAVLAEHDLELPVPAFDLGVAAFLLDPAGARTTQTLAAQQLGRKLASFEEVVGRGAKAKTPASLPAAEIGAWAGAEVRAIADLAPLLTAQIERDALLSLFVDVELPLTAVLARMERAGVRVDEEVLAELHTHLEKELAAIEAEVYALAGESFQIASPKQLQRILFEKLKLPAVKKTKTGYSTDESVLEKLSAQHELPARVLAFRRLSKLKGTYVDALPPLVNPRTGRIHPIFNQTGAATGRLSCTNPNVQNIPIRTEEGIRIREAFVPAEGTKLLSADYSQVELRLMAHFSEDDGLIEAFAAGEDIHRRTAAEVLDVAPEDVTAEQRARAKAINFGIIYGSSAFGIANQLGIATGEAQEFIDGYFAEYPGVKRFMGETIEQAREDGFVRTLLGRRRFLPDLRSKNQVLRNAAERMAVNTVIQGTAADLIKKAMVAVDADLREAGLAARMLLQVHDELVFEVPEDEVEALRERVVARMEAAFELRVPLVAETGVGASWREAH